MTKAWSLWERCRRWLAGRRGRLEQLQSVEQFRRLLDTSGVESMTVASIPPELRRRLQEEAIRGAFSRLEMPLRFLLNATTPGREPRSIEMCHEILRLWRQGLEREVRLTPDDPPNSVRAYDPSMDLAYNIHGCCRPGQWLRILIPCWRLNGVVVVRGEAEPIATPTPAAPVGQAPSHA